MRLGLRLLLGFFLITGLAAFFIVRLFVLEVRPSVREAMEDMLVDTANILAELARDDLARLAPGATLEGSRFALAVSDYAARPVDAQIWGLAKQTLDYRVYVTDARGRVVYDSGRPGSASALGEDYSRWRDVALTLSGRYGARATREVADDEGTSVLYVAAPVRDGAATIGVLTVAKPVATVSKFVARAERNILTQGAWLLALSLAVGALVTGWVIVSVRRLRRYAQQVQFGQRLDAPSLPGELGELARAMESMRERLDGRDEVERTVRALTHELKSPMAAIAGAAELLHDELPPADRERFAQQIQDQVRRQQDLVEQLLELSKLEHRRSLDTTASIDLVALVDRVLQRAAARAQQRQVALRWLRRDAATIEGAAELLELALGNVLENALDYAPAGSAVDMTVECSETAVRLSVRDRGPGVDDAALPRLGARFYSTPRPAPPGAVARKGSGLGLAIVREVLALHRARLRISNSAPGLQVDFTFATHTSSSPRAGR